MAERDQASNSDFYHRQNHARFARVFYRMRLFHRYVNYTLASQYLLCFCDENSVKYCSWNPFCEFRNLDQWIQSSGILDEFIQVQFLFGEKTQVLESSKMTWQVHYMTRLSDIHLKILYQYYSEKAEEQEKGKTYNSLDYQREKLLTKELTFYSVNKDHASAASLD